jgi:prophage antirepressor-like protein
MESERLFYFPQGERMSKELQVFKFNESDVRAVTINGEPWFVLKDICDVLGLGSPHKVSDRIDNDERSQIPVTDSIGRRQDTTIINESGFYNVILRSDKPEAKAFKKWVTSEVLPSIRKTGSYSLIPKNFSEALRLAADQAEQIEQQKQALELAAPKVEYFDAVASSKTAVHMNEVAKTIDFQGIGRNKLFAFLREREILMNDNTPYQEYVDRGYFRLVQNKYNNSKGEVQIVFTTLVYQKGVQYIINKLEEYGYKKNGLV